MKRNSEIRSDARASLRGHWGAAVLTTLVYVLITFLCEGPDICVSASEAMRTIGLYNFLTDMDLPSLVGFTSWPLILFVMLPLGFGYENTFLNLKRGDDRLTGNMFDNGFKWRYWRALGTRLLVSIYTILWSLLLLIPGIIKAYAYSMTSFISRDCPDIPIDDCIYLSRKMMNGHKFRLFLLDLGFIGWAILCILTFGIGFFWLQPYIQCSHAHFYEEVKAELYGDDPIAVVLQRYGK